MWATGALYAKKHQTCLQPVTNQSPHSLILLTQLHMIKSHDRITTPKLTPARDCGVAAHDDLDVLEAAVREEIFAGNGEDVLTCMETWSRPMIAISASWCAPPQKSVFERSGELKGDGFWLGEAAVSCAWMVARNSWLSLRDLAE